MQGWCSQGLASHGDGHVGRRRVALTRSLLAGHMEGPRPSEPPRGPHAVLEGKVKALKEKRGAERPSPKKPRARRGKAGAEEPRAQLRTYLTDGLLDGTVPWGERGGLGGSSPPVSAGKEVTAGPEPLSLAERVERNRRLLHEVLGMHGVCLGFGRHCGSQWGPLLWRWALGNLSWGAASPRQGRAGRALGCPSTYAILWTYDSMALQSPSPQPWGPVSIFWALRWQNVLQGVGPKGSWHGAGSSQSCFPPSPPIPEVPASDGDWDSGVSLQDAEGCRWDSKCFAWGQTGLEGMGAGDTVRGRSRAGARCPWRERGVGQKCLPSA